MFSLKCFLFRQDDLVTSELFNEQTFYKTFIQDLEGCQKEVIIESPYITSSRMEKLYPILGKLLARGVKITITTRDPVDHDENIRHQATNEILHCKELGINIILLTGYHHRKIAIIDKTILWEGSLNILSFSYSREIMRRIEGKPLVKQMVKFLKLSDLV